MGKDIEKLQIGSEDNVKSHGKIYDKLAEFNTVVAVSSAKTDGKFDTIITTVTKIEKTVDELASKPSKRWDGIVMAAITAIVGMAVGFLIK